MLMLILFQQVAHTLWNVERSWIDQSKKKKKILNFFEILENTNSKKKRNNWNSNRHSFDSNWYLINTAHRRIHTTPTLIFAGFVVLVFTLCASSFSSISFESFDKRPIQPIECVCMRVFGFSQNSRVCFSSLVSFFLFLLSVSMRNCIKEDRTLDIGLNGHHLHSSLLMGFQTSMDIQEKWKNCY